MKTNKKLFFIIVAGIGFISFFLPWLGDFRSMSGYDLVTSGQKLDKDALFLVGLPISFLLVIVLKIAKNIPNIVIKLFEILPIAIIIIIYIKIFGTGSLKDLKYFLDDDIFKILGIGFILTLSSGIILIFDPLNKENND